MKSIFPTALVALLFGFTAPIQARGERGQQGGHPQAARPAQQQARPAQQAKPAQRQARPIEQQRQTRPVAREQAQQARPARLQQAARPQQPQAPPANRVQQDDHGRTQARAPEARPEGRGGDEREHGRISHEHYVAHFGREHSFHVNRGDYEHRRFQYGGYAFGFIDPWPMGWGYSDDVYVEYIDGGYYMYNRIQPGIRISVNIL